MRLSLIHTFYCPLANNNYSASDKENRKCDVHIFVYTVFPYIKARAFISFPPLLTRHINEAGVYLREAFIRGNTVSHIILLCNSMSQVASNQLSTIVIQKPF